MIMPHDVFRFQREAEALAALNHSNIAAIYDVQEANSIRFLVLELVDGENLSERLSTAFQNYAHVLHSLGAIFPAFPRRGGCATMKMLRSLLSGADGAREPYE